MQKTKKRTIINTMKVYAIHLGKGVRNMFDNLIDVQQKLSDKTVTVLGVGVSNLPLVTFLWENGIRNITLRDKNPSPEALALAQQYNLPLISAEEYLSDLNEDVIFRSPGIMPTKAELVDAINRGAILTSEMELFFDLCPAKIIGITGSDGKTTTTTLIYEILKKAGYTCHLGGNIGNPLLPELAQIKEDHIVIVELSSFQLMTMKKSADIAVITNLAPNHLDKHTDMAEYIDAKKNIFKHQGTSDKLILNADNAITADFQGNGITRFFSRKKNTDIFMDGDAIIRGGRVVLNKHDILIPGEHNVENYMAAILAVEGLVTDDVIRRVAKTFGGVEHRIELVRVKDGVRFYNDSIASSPSRTIAGLRSFKEKVILIAGGYDKHIPYDVLGPEICDHVKTVFVNGATAMQIKTAIEKAPQYAEGHPVIITCEDFTDAVLKAANSAVDGDVILMSPASAAFDQFKNFMERGKYFKKLVSEL